MEVTGGHWLVDRSFLESQTAELATHIDSIGELEITTCGNKQRWGRLVVASNSELRVNVISTI